MEKIESSKENKNLKKNSWKKTVKKIYRLVEKIDIKKIEWKNIDIVEKYIDIGRKIDTGKKMEWKIK